MAARAPSVYPQRSLHGTGPSEATRSFDAARVCTLVIRTDHALSSAVRSRTTSSRTRSVTAWRSSSSRRAQPGRACQQILAAPLSAITCGSRMTVSASNVRPNMLVGGFPATGLGSSDLYEIYGNLYYHNPYESLLQASGRVAIHDNVFVDGAGGPAIALQNHDLPLRLAHVYNNTIYSAYRGIRVLNVPDQGHAIGNRGNGGLRGCSPVSDRRDYQRLRQRNRSDLQRRRIPDQPHHRAGLGQSLPAHRPVPGHAIGSYSHLPPRPTTTSISTRSPRAPVPPAAPTQVREPTPAGSSRRSPSRS